MAEYVYIDNLAKKGTIGISNLVFESIVCDAINKIPGITESSKRLKRNQKIRLNRPVRTYIRSGVVHIWLAVDVKNGIDEKETVSLLEKEIHAALDTATEQVPYDIEIKIERRY